MNSGLDELVNELAPRGIRFVSLADVATTVPGLTGKTKADFADGNAKFVSYKNVFANPAIDQTVSNFVKIKVGERQNPLHRGDVVITGSSENVEDVGMSSVVVTEPQEHLYLNSFCFALRFTDAGLLLPEFSKHLFRGEGVRQQIRRCASGVTRINVSKERFMRIRIPVPPIEVQREIARILDNFTGFEAQLAEELQRERMARRTQFLYCRQGLLEPGAPGDVRWMEVGEICHVSRGRVISKDYLQAHPGEYPVYSSQTLNRGIFGYIDTFACDDESITWTTDGANAGSVFYHYDEKFSITNVCGLLTARHPAASLRYVYYQLQLRAPAFVSAGMGNPKLMAKPMSQIQVPVPSAAEQARVVEVLDDLMRLSTGLDAELHREKQLRRQQYDHYRGSLLAFKGAVA